MNAKYLKLAALILIVLAAGATGGYWWANRAQMRPAAATTAVPQTPGERKVLYWANPMNPGIHSDRPMKDNMGMDYTPVYAPIAPTQRRVLYWANPMNPGIHSDRPMKDNMGMDYVPVYASATPGENDSGLRIDPRQAQNLGVRLTTVQMRPMGQAIQTVGTVAVDQNRIETITPRFSGWVTRLRVRAVGDPVVRGQVLADIYSPELYNAQQEYLIARQQNNAADSQGLLAATKEKLHLLGMPGNAMAALESTGKPMRDVPILAPESGVVTALNIRQGGYVSSQSSLFEISNLDRVWVSVALYAYQLQRVQIGNTVQLQLPGYPGKTWNGRLDFLYPTLDPQTRTVAARLSFANPGGILRPGMYANATVLANTQSALAVPSSVVLRTQDGDYVMLAQGQGHFLPVQVALGPEADGWVAILKGLKAGDRVVESAQFLLYSESQFQSVKARMLGGNTDSAAPPTGGPAPGAPSTSTPPAGASVAPQIAPAPSGSMPGMNMAPAGASHD